MNHNAPYLRHQRVSELIKKELSQLILREVEFDALITITNTEVTKKLDHARIYISIIPSEKGEGVLKTLKKRQPYLQNLLLKKINIHPMPKIDFHLDKGNENASSIEKILMDQNLEK